MYGNSRYTMYVMLSKLAVEAIQRWIFSWEFMVLLLGVSLTLCRSLSGAHIDTSFCSVTYVFAKLRGSVRDFLHGQRSVYLHHPYSSIGTGLALLGHRLGVCLIVCSIAVILFIFPNLCRIADSCTFSFAEYLRGANVLARYFTT